MVASQKKKSHHPHKVDERKRNLKGIGEIRRIVRNFFQNAIGQGRQNAWNNRADRTKIRERKTEKQMEKPAREK